MLLLLYLIKKTEVKKRYYRWKIMFLWRNIKR